VVKKSKTPSLALTDWQLNRVRGDGPDHAASVITAKLPMKHDSFQIVLVDGDLNLIRWRWFSIRGQVGESRDQCATHRARDRYCSAAGSVGAVLCIEASGLARNGRDWHTLLEFCRLVDALIIDEDGIYDARQANDRLLLGMKGTLSEMELSTLRQRSFEALMQKARRGELLMSVAVGYIRASNDRIEMDPDRRIGKAIELVFRKFRQFGSVRQVLVWLRQERVELPAVVYGAEGRAVRWKLPVYNVLHHILTNPIYGGAYVFGRTRTVTRIQQGHKHTVGGVRVPQEQWQVLIPAHHEGYIEWDEYQANQRQITQNAAMKGHLVRGPARNGGALLAGLLRCGHCGRKFHVVTRVNVEQASKTVMRSRPSFNMGKAARPWGVSEACTPGSPPGY
jgi:hypothetical protein